MIKRDLNSYLTLIVKIGSSCPGSENLSGTLKNSNESPFIRLGATFINFSKFFPRLRLFQGLRLLILNKIPKATFIKEATTIRNSRVIGYNFLIQPRKQADLAVQVDW